MKIPLAAISAVILVVPVSGASGQTASYSYDALGRLVIASEAGSPTPATSTYSYDAAGNRTNVNVAPAATIASAALKQLQGKQGVTQSAKAKPAR